MDKKTGFKECSRCGLRNKPAAKQCDFCGQRFEVNDDWEQQIDALEKMSRNSGRKVEVSEDMSRRIEATIITKEMVESREKATAESAKPVAEPEVARPEPVRPLPMGSSPSRAETPVMTSEPVLKSDAEVPSAEEMGPGIEPPVEVAHPELKPLKVTKKRALIRKKKRPSTPSTKFFRWGLDKKDLMSVVFTGLLGLGAIVFVVALALSGELGTMLSWGFIVIAGVLVVMGFSQVGINWDVAEEPRRVDIPGKAEDEVVEICPHCHELVGVDLDRCPSCGTEFEPAEDD